MGPYHSFPFARLRRRPLDDAARRAAPGQFIRLDKGMVHYEVAGPENGPVLVLVHGLSVPGHVWDPLFVPLARQGFKVIRFDLYGRGFSDRPRVRYDAALFWAQVLDLLAGLKIRGRVHLAGVSMGGAVCAAVAQSHPERTSRLCLINPAGMMPAPGAIDRLKRLPGVGECHMGLWGKKELLAGLYRDFHTQVRPRAYTQKMIEQMAFSGFSRALLSTLRSGILYNMAPVYRALGKTSQETLLIWGLEDQTIPFKSCTRLRRLIPDMVYCPIENAGHLPHFDAPARVLARLKAFLTG